MWVPSAHGENSQKRCPPFRLRSLPPRTFGVFLDGMGFLGWIAWTGPDRMDSWTIKGWSRDGMDGKKQRGWIRGFHTFPDIITKTLKVLLSKRLDIHKYIIKIGTNGQAGHQKSPAQHKEIK